MLLSFVFLLFSVTQFAVFASDPYERCTALSYILDSNGATEYSANAKVGVSFTSMHDNVDDYVQVVLNAYNSKGKDVKLTVSFEVKGKPHTLYCSSDDDKHVTPTSPYTRNHYTFACSWKLFITGNRQIAPVTSNSINIDLLTIDDNVPITLGYNDIKTVVAPNLKASTGYQLTYLECPEENRMTFFDNKQKNRLMLKKNMSYKQMETFIYGLVPDEQSADRTVKFVNADGVSLTVQCNKSLSTLSGFVQRGDKMESIDKLFTYKSLDGYRCAFKLPLLVETDNIKFDFNSKPLNFSFSSTTGSSVNKANILFHTDTRKWG